MRDALKILTFLFIMTFLFWILLVFKSAHASPISPQEELIQVDAAVLHIVQKGIPKHGIKPRPNHPIVKDTESRKELVEGIVAAGRRWNIPQTFLVAMAFREGSFQNDQVGEIGERSTFQMVDYVIDKLGCDVSTYAGAADCAAQWLSRKRSDCGHLKGGFVRYATGRKICRPDTERLKWMTWDRFGIAERLSKLEPVPIMKTEFQLLRE